ncbi:MAG: MotA/TolQ/ExbB proton channel family protein [Proteobacteria bacterium]|nr:MotA/TolQ/ExbB proton channel family protein [Pseudomonadota bacterium]
MFELVKSGGWLMLPIILCSIISISIIAERFWSLRREKVLPKHLVATVWNSVKQENLKRADIEALSKESALGKIISTGLLNRCESRERIKECIEERGREVVHDLERFLNTLGTIASISPLLGLLGTVIGMISVFAAITQHGVGDPGALAGGISQAMITTAAGLTVAIISLVFYRYFRRKVDGIVVVMEREAIKMVDVLHNNRKQHPDEDDCAQDMAPEPKKNKSKKAKR